MIIALLIIAIAVWLLAVLVMATALADAAERVIRWLVRVNWPRLWCAIWGHDCARLVSPPGVMGGWGSPWVCLRCGESHAGMLYPPMPPVPPSKREPDTEALPQGAGYQDAPDITLSDFIAERTELEHRLYDYIKAETSAFTKRTGATVSAIEVSMLEVTRISEPAEHMASSVRVVTPLD